MEHALWLGRVAGDEIIIAVSQRLQRSVPDDAVVARIGGDEFAVLVLMGPSETEAYEAAERLRVVVSQPLQIGEATISPSVSGGVVLVTSLVTPVDEILMEGGHATEVAKAHGGGRIEIFDTAARQHLRHTRRLEIDLRDALNGQQLAMAYEPIIDLMTGAVWGLEALVRWEHPRLGAVSPVDFIPVAEQSTLIVPLGAWILRRVCGEIARLRAAGINVPPVSINISPRQLDQPDFVRPPASRPA